jgi:endonuclease G, mitochondrial
MVNQHQSKKHKLKKLLTSSMLAITLSTGGVGSLLFSQSANAFDLSSWFHNLFNHVSAPSIPVAGQGAVDNNEGIDVDKLRDPDKCKAFYPWGRPIHKDKTVESRLLYLCRGGYAVGFDPATKTPLWVSEHLYARDITTQNAQRVEDFKPDPNVPKKMQATLEDYKGSGFDRGHMAPAGDNVFNQQAMNESFYLTNMVPQVGSNNNRGIWEDIEKMVRFYTVNRHELLVVTGPLYLNGKAAFMGQSKVAVPTHLFKVVVDPSNYDTMAFIVPNQQVVTSDTKFLDKGNPAYPQTLSQNAYYCNGGHACTPADFLVNIDEVEKLTGLTFFTKALPNQKNKIRMYQQGIFRVKQN